MRHGVSRLSLPGTLRNYRQHTPVALSALLLCLFGIYLAGQINAWLQLSRTPIAPAANDSRINPASQSDPQRLEFLFGALPAAQSTTTANTAGLTLHGSFVHADPGRSSAIIQFDGQPPQLVWQGQEVQSGISLHSVHPDHVEIMRDGRREILNFPAVRPPVFIPEESSQQPYETTDGVDTEQMQQQMEALRQQLENAVNQPATEPSNEPPMEDD